MCGRYDLNSPPIKLKSRFQTDFGRIAQALSPRYNITPSVPVVLVRIEDGERRGATASWGLVPRWAKDLAGIKPINARGESIAGKPMFREAFKRRRCLIPADGFFEWKRSASGKQPWRFTMADKEPFAMAGIWEEWGKDSEILQTCAIITIGANDLMAPIHDRMPVIIAHDAYARWLDPANDAAFELLMPYPAEEMTAYPVSTRVNSPKNDDPELIVPVPQKN